MKNEVAQMPVVPDGPALDDSAGVPVSVWEWMPGRVATTGLTAAQHAQVGTALGEIHALFAPLPQSKEPAPLSDAETDAMLRGLTAAAAGS